MIPRKVTVNSLSQTESARPLDTKGTTFRGWIGQKL